MYGDAAFVLGMSHRVCEDYAYARQEWVGWNACVSDGCSGSKDTDVGSRLVALSWPSLGVPHTCADLQGILDQADDVCCQLGLPVEAIDATLLGIHAEQGRDQAGATVEIFGTGDGYWAIKREGALEIGELSVASGFPYYLNYHSTRNPYRKEQYLSQGNCLIAKCGPADAGQVCPDGLFQQRHCLGSRRGEVFAVFSDGVAACVRNGELIPAWEVIAELMAFKGMAGSFVQRRVQGFLRTLRQAGGRFDDDLSMAAICVGTA